MSTPEQTAAEQGDQETAAQRPVSQCPVAHGIEPPRGSRMPGIVQLYLGLRHTVAFSRWSQRTFGDVFVAKAFPMGKSVYIADPEVVREIFAGPHDSLHAGATNGIFLKAIFGERGILTVDGEEHAKTRKALMPPFRGKLIDGYSGVMREEAERRIASWKVGDVIRVEDEARAITLEVILRTVFGAVSGPQMDELRSTVIKASKFTPVSTTWMVFPKLGKFRPWRSFAQLIERTNELLDEFIEERRNAPDLAERTDTLSLLVRSSGEDDEWLRNQLMSLLGAGHETTTTSLAWAMELLSRHPEAREKARESDEYLDAVITETLRIRTVLPGVGRKTSRALTLGGFAFKKGTMLNPQIEAIHNDPRIWGDPETFRPERFLNTKPSLTEYIPFGGGKRRCIGSIFALKEMNVALRTILDAMDFEHVGAEAETQKRAHVTLAPSKGGLIRRTR
jgi:cytochrome P450